MKIPARLHRLAEIDADAWIFQPRRADRIRRALDFTSQVAAVSFALYLAFLVVTALLYAAHTN